MISFLKNIWGQYETNREYLKEQFEIEQASLEQQIVEEQESKDVGANSSCMKNVIAKRCTDVKEDDPAKNACFKRKGVITSLNDDLGVIDNYISFGVDATTNGFCDFKVGYQVEFLAYKEANSDFIKVVNISKIIERYWDEKPEEKELAEQISELRAEAPIYFNTQTHNVMGIIKERRQTSIVVETDYKMLTIELDEVDIEFVPRTGDRVYLTCNMQQDESYVDQQGEILEVKRVEPSRILRNEKCTVQRVYDEFAVLNGERYVLFDDLPKGIHLHLDDIVKVDLIECEFQHFVWRCIKLEQLEKTFALLKATEGNNPNQLSRVGDNQAISVTGDTRCILVNVGETKTVTVRLKNNCQHPFKIVRIEFDKRRDSQLSMLVPSLDGWHLEANVEMQLKLQVTAKFYGESVELFTIRFEKFRIRKSITVVVCQSDTEAQDAERRLIAAMVMPAGYGRSIAQRSRHYAHQVWSNSTEIVPGECIATKRRFVAVRIGYFEVPEALRRLYLTSERRSEMIDSLESMYPCLKQPLTYGNYVQRFQMLLHLEEIEYFVNFRNFDRERAHFERDGEYLSLTIENLAERRPSLVLGDIVRAINPWASEQEEKRCFEGIIHRVLFNRVLLKFNSTFQEKYNGEDYRLEFYFSRFGFRKQHHALHRIVKDLGEKLLFPSKIDMRPHLQLEMRLDESGNMKLYDSIIKWYNPTLNTVQKRAVCNILRGEAEKAPYVIFGPPGTGKTVTLVEVILQLLYNLPSARILVGTPSNSSADLITQRLIDSNALKSGEFIRLVSQNQIEKDLIPESLMKYCATVDIGSDGTCKDSMITTESGLKLRCQIKFLGRHRVTISTCTTLGNFLQMNFPPNHFTHVLIDEAGQCTEPESIVPITMVSKRSGQVILVGDPHQLQAIVINRLASEHGYSLSFLERILERAPYKKDLLRFPETSGYDPRLMTKLLYNYRALPSIMNIYSSLFYDSELIAMISEEQSREAKMLAQLNDIIIPNMNGRSPAHGTFFYGIRSENQQEDDSPSWFNPGEAKSIFVMTLKLFRNGVKPDSIGILTPYMKQVKHLRNMFVTADISMPKIGSVEEFQGQERDIILVSTVRSSESQLVVDSRYALGFVRCVKRMNVAISRARSIMIIFGNPHLLSIDPSWRRLIKYCADNNAYIGCDLPLGITEEEEESDDDSETEAELVL